MEATPINDRIMLARISPSPGGTIDNRLDFSKILDKEIMWSSPAPPPFSHDETSEGSHAGRMQEKNSLLFVGELTDQAPTVSNLLIKHPVFGKECWDIIYSGANQEKPYQKILAGTKIYINPETKELFWGEMVDSNQVMNPPQPTTRFTLRENEPGLSRKVPDDSVSKNLVDAVKPYLGKKYEEIDCYELIIKGLKKMGVKYQGSGGLGHELIKMAIENNLPINAYFNGEGIIKASGSTVFQKSILKVKNPEQQAKEIVEALLPKLEKGQILSFSTPTKGHTGIISKKDDMWTYINSGDIDNSVGKPQGKKGVAEENLTQEILNWFKMAGNRNEDLKISVGKLNEEKLAAYSSGKKEMIKRV